MQRVAWEGITGDLSGVGSVGSSRLSRRDCVSAGVNASQAREERGRHGHLHRLFRVKVL